MQRTAVAWDAIFQSNAKSTLAAALRLKAEPWTNPRTALHQIEELSLSGLRTIRHHPQLLSCGNCTNVLQGMQARLSSVVCGFAG